MKSIARVSLAFALVAMVAFSAKAEDKKPPVKPKDPYASQFAFPKQIKLDDKQKEQLEKLQAEYSPKLADLAKKQAGVVSADRIKAANEARKKASDAILTPDRVKAAKEAAKDKKGKEAAKAYQDALKLTEEEQKTLKGLNKVFDDTLKMTKEEREQIAAISSQRGKLLKEIAAKKMAILTDEQKESLKPKDKAKDKAKDKPKDKTDK